MKHTTRLIACLLALALTACTAAPQDMPAGTTTETAAAPAQTAEPTHRNTRRTGHAYTHLHDLGRGGGPRCRLQRDEH